jgi:hypothetical protein
LYGGGILLVKHVPNPKHEIPAFAEAAPRRQAKLETISNFQNPKHQDPFLLGHLSILILDLFRISIFGFRVFAGPEAFLVHEITG